MSRWLPPFDREDWSNEYATEVSADFKAKVALDALSGVLTMADFSAEHGVHPNMISQWKRRAQESLPELFAEKADRTELGSYTLQMGTSVGAAAATRARFQLLVGDEAYIQESLEAAEVPAVTALLPNRPNPFNPATLLRFDLDRPALVELTIHDVWGHTVARVLHERIEAGRREILWTGRVDSGRPVAAGAYFYRLSTEFGFQATGKMMLVR